MAVYALIAASLFHWFTATPTPSPTHAGPQGHSKVTPIVHKTTIVKENEPFVVSPPAPSLSPLGEHLILEFEVGGQSGYNPHPELPDLRLSGVTIAIGYDLHQYSKAVILSDWKDLPGMAAQRLADTQPFYGKTAVESWHQVRDIYVPWAMGLGVFEKIDVAREWARAQRALPGFLDLRANAQAASLSLGFNRGWSMVGDNRREMRDFRDAAAKKDYEGMANAERKMVRVWVGTSIYKGMRNRRLAEADLILKP